MTEFLASNTTSGAVTRVPDVLTTYIEIQDRLRTEIVEFMKSAGSEDINRGVIDALPYLDAVCRETLRLYPSVNVVERMQVIPRGYPDQGELSPEPCRALQDTGVPLKYPVDTYTGLHTSIIVPKWTTVSLGIHNINRDPDVWGGDTNQFDPERWLDGRASSTE
ncbi:cytochrome P450 family protein [Ceratobasidium sp. AG-Ba]|nr:cytochrome P450 family protein [Ceratobasidium sp. AG-Ba]QRW15042.1 cytochrome P450 family protein [Ceratobasidium sp. AG-Ba]